MSGFLERLFGLDGQAAVVIGASGTLGGALAEGLARAGADVVVAGRSASRGHRRVEAIRALSGRAGFRHVDATSRESVEALLEYTLGEFGHVDVLVNGAWVDETMPDEPLDDATWHRVVDGNLQATYLACQVFGPRMARQPGGGAILNLGSTPAPAARGLACSAARAAVVDLTRNLARRYAPQGVRINVLCPGMFPGEPRRATLDPQQVAQLTEATPLGRCGEPQELVGAALLLVSRQAGGFITGAELHVDGGRAAGRA